MVDVKELRPETRYSVGLVSTYVKAHLAAWRRRGEMDDVERFCFFVGYPSSGHSLIGALMNAHHAMVISHELDALKFLNVRFSREQVFAMILQRDEWFRRRGQMWNDYDYGVPGQWQGRYDTLRVIGDKAGGISALRLLRNPAQLDRVRRAMRMPIAIVHIVRNPYDNVTTMHKKGMRRSKRALSWYVQRYADHVAGVQVMLDRALPGEVHAVRYEDLVADPRSGMRGICDFLNLDAPTDYLDAVAARVAPSPSRTRQAAPWTAADRAAVASTISQYSFLSGYSFDD